MEEVKPLPQNIKQDYVRPTWDEYFLSLLEPLGKRGTCDRGRNAAVIASPHHTILATGYAGAPPGLPHCDEAGHMMKTTIHEDGRQSQHCVRTLHAEENAILQCAKDGTKLEGATMYVKMTPCYNCAMRIIRVGIKRVVAQKVYHASQQATEILLKAGVKVDVLDNGIMHYENQ